MKLLAIPCEHIETTLTLRSNKPKRSIFVEDGTRGDIADWKNTTAVFVCVEKKDQEERQIAEKGARTLKSLLREMNSNKLVLIPFVHLTKEIAPPAVAYKIIKEIERRISKEDLNFSRFQFGWHRELILDILCSSPIKYKEV